MKILFNMLLLLAATLHAESSFGSLGNVIFDSADDWANTVVLDTTGKLGIRTTAMSNTLTVSGNSALTGKLQSTNLKSRKIVKSAVTISANYNAGEASLILADTSSANLTISLPYAGNVSGRVYEIKKISLLGYVDIKVAGGGNVEKRASYRLTKDGSSYAYGKFMSNGVEWYNLGKNGGVYSERGMRFDGVDDYVDLGNIHNFERTDAFSFGCWFKDMGGSSIALITKGSGYNGYKIQIGPDGPGTLTVIIGNSVGNRIEHRLSSGNTYYELNNWHHLFVTYGGSSVLSGLNVYLNGKATIPTSSIDTLTLTILNANSLKVANIDSSYYQGQIDDISIWNKSLTQSEVSAIYNNGSPTDLLQHSASANLVGYWKMGDGDTYPTVKDWSSSGNNGTMTNMSSASFTEETP